MHNDSAYFVRTTTLAYEEICESIRARFKFNITCLFLLPDRIPIKTTEDLITHKVQDGATFDVKFTKKCAVCTKPAPYGCLCRKIHYCSKECQREDWKKHKLSCTAKSQT